MNTRKILAGISIITAVIVCGCSITKTSQKKLIPATYIPVDKQLYDTILYQDSLLFDHFNARDLVGFHTFFSESLEIFQDNTGFRNYLQSMEAFRNLFTSSYVLKRQLLKTTVEIYPVKNYGAIELGQHTFCHEENGKQDCGTFKFVHIWEHKNGQWKIARIITYDHKL